MGQARESAAARQVARRFGLAESTVGALDLRYLERWAAARRKPALRSDQNRIRGLQESSLNAGPVEFLESPRSLEQRDSEINLPWKSVYTPQSSTIRM